MKILKPASGVIRDRKLDKLREKQKQAEQDNNPIKAAKLAMEIIKYRNGDKTDDK